MRNKNFLINRYVIITAVILISITIQSMDVKKYCEQVNLYTNTGDLYTNQNNLIVYDSSFSAKMDEESKKKYAISLLDHCQIVQNLRNNDATYQQKRKKFHDSIACSRLCWMSSKASSVMGWVSGMFTVSFGASLLSSHTDPHTKRYLLYALVISAGSFLLSDWFSALTDHYNKNCIYVGKALDEQLVLAEKANKEIAHRNTMREFYIFEKKFLKKNKASMQKPTTYFLSPFSRITEMEGFIDNIISLYNEK